MQPLLVHFTSQSPSALISFPTTHTPVWNHTAICLLLWGLSHLTRAQTLFSCSACIPSTQNNAFSRVLVSWINTRERTLVFVSSYHGLNATHRLGYLVLTTLGADYPLHGDGVGDLENGDKGTREEPVAARAPGGRAWQTQGWTGRPVAGASPEMGRVGQGPGLLGPWGF